MLSASQHLLCPTANVLALFTKGNARVGFRSIVLVISSRVIGDTNEANIDAA